MDLSSRLMKPYLLFLTCLLCFLAGSSAEFFTTGEAREALVAQTMVIEGDLLSSHRLLDDIATKPPLLHWLIVFFASIFGSLTEVASRLPSILLASITLVCWFNFVSREAGQRQALVAVGVTATCVEWLRYASMARVDMALACFISLALMSLYRSRFLFAVIFLSAASLTKGPVGSVIPCAVYFLYLASGRTLSVKNIVQLGIIGVLSLVPLFVWYSLQGTEIIQIALQENLGRLVGEMDNAPPPHAHGALYMFGQILLGTLPWSPIYLASLFLVKRQKMDNFTRFCVIWTLSVFIFFLIPASKRGAYLLPMYLPLGFLFARNILAIKDSVSEKISLGFVYIALGLLFLLCPILSGLTKLDLPSETMTTLKALELQSVFEYLCLIVTVATLFLILRNKTIRFEKIILATLLLTTFAKTTLYQSYARDFSPESFINTRLENINTVTVSDTRLYAAIFYARQHNSEIKFTSEPAEFELFSTKNLDSGENSAYSDHFYSRPGQYLVLKHHTEIS